MTASVAAAGVPTPALDTAPITPTRYAFWFLASGGALLDGFSVEALAVALPLLTRAFAISPVVGGLIGSSMSLLRHRCWRWRYRATVESFCPLAA
ncbi:MAG: hypothetical protein WA446_05980 [Steroidobacteraceae bacterium]|jgi:hypothetical protein